MRSNKVKKNIGIKKILSNFNDKPIACIDSEGNVSDFCVVSVSKKTI